MTTTGLQHSAIQRITATAEHQMSALKVPGVAVGIAWNGEVQTAGFGITNIDDPRPART